MYQAWPGRESNPRHADFQNQVDLPLKLLQEARAARIRLNPTRSLARLYCKHPGWTPNHPPFHPPSVRPR
jgi:hypothetical protein